MSSLVALLGVGSLAFAATNVDGLLVLLAFFSDRRYAARQVVVGQYLGICVLIGVAVLCSLLSVVVPAHHVGLIGFVPLGLGAWQALAAGPAAAIGSVAGRGLRPVAVAIVTISNGGDNLGTYVPLFSAMTAAEVRITVALFLLLTALWCAIAYRLVHLPRLAPLVERYGTRVRPWVLMALGAFILIRTQALPGL